jgi:hypothetical protein
MEPDRDSGSGGAMQGGAIDLDTTRFRRSGIWQSEYEVTRRF